MAIAYAVVAEVVDITADTPRSDDVFLVDTNVWFWTTYSRAALAPAPPPHHKTKHYPEFLRRAMGVDAELLRCDLSVGELAHLIEKTEYDIFCQQTAYSGRPKDFRHTEAAARTRVVAEIQAAWGQVEQMSADVVFQVDAALGAAVLKQCAAACIDGYDAMMLYAAAQSGIRQVVSDDSDLCTVPGIQLFTANRNVVQAAQGAGRLISR